MKKVCMFGLLIMSVFCLQGSQSQVSVQAAPEKFKVAVIVSRSNDDTDSEKSQKNLMRSWIKRELRSLQDVEIVDYVLDRATVQYLISITMLEVRYADGSKTGLFAISLGFRKRIPPSRFNDFWREHYTKFPAFEVPGGGVYTSVEASLDKFCKSIVADFDTEYLEPERLFR